MKLFITAFVVLCTCGNCLAAEYGAAKSTASLAGQYFPRHFKRAVRKGGKPGKTDIKPVVQTTGITTGLVVVYGHIIKPPYKVQVENGKTLINGVPVGPGTTEKDIISSRAGDLLEEANKIFCERRKTGNYTVAAGEILALFERSTGTVISAKWDKAGVPPKGVLLVHWRGNARDPGVRFSAGACRKYSGVGSDKGMKLIAENNLRRNSEFYSKTLQKSLEEGKLLFFSYDGSHTTLSSDTKAKLDEAMKDESLGRNELLKKLENLGFNHRGALEIIKNYEPRQ